MLRRQLESEEGKGGRAGGGWWKRVLGSVCVCVPDDKATVQEGVLAALTEGKSVYIRR